MVFPALIPSIARRAPGFLIAPLIQFFSVSTALHASVSHTAKATFGRVLQAFTGSFAGFWAGASSTRSESFIHHNATLVEKWENYNSIGSTM